MADGFEWIEDLEPPLREKLGRLMDYVADGEHGAVDAIVPSLVATAREMGNAWVEVFARNFELRSLILHREDTREGLGKAIELLDRAHQPDTEDCPQSVCTAHAVCSAYGLRDRDGYVQDRLRVSTEGLARIDPRRVCWLCISNEHADALIDAGEPQAALDFLEKNGRIRLDAGAELDPDDFGLREANALIALGRPADALKILDDAACTYRGESWQRTWRQWRARALVELERYEEAVENLSDPDDVLADGGFRLHFETLRRLYGHGAMPDDEITSQVCRLGREAVRRGVASAALEALQWALVHLLDQRERTLGLAVLEVADQAPEDLRDGTAAKAELAAFRTQFEALSLPKNVDEPTHFEEALAKLQSGGAEEMSASLSHVWHQFGFPERARALLVEQFERCPESDGLYNDVCHAAREAGDLAALRRLVDNPSTGPDGEPLSLVHRAQLEELEGDPVSGVDSLKAAHALRPEWSFIVSRLAPTLFDAGRHAEAAAVWASAAAATEQPNGYNWDLLTCATMLEDWRTVREQCRVVGYEIDEGDDPIQGDFGAVRVMYEDQMSPFSAWRSSPAVAEVLGLRAPLEGQRHGDVVLVHPVPLNIEAVQSGDEPPLLRVIETLSEATIEVVAIDGQHPGDEAQHSFREALREARFFFQDAADDAYQVRDPDTGETHLGMYWVVALEVGREAELLALFDALDGPGARVWYELLTLMERHDEAQAHEAIAESWGMI